MIAIYRRYTEPFAVALILLFFLTTAAPIAYGNTFSSAWDQGSYLRLGLQIRHWLALTDGNRHPLLPLLLAPFARPDIGYFTWAKVLSLVLGLAGLLIVYWTARRTLTPPWAAAATLLLAANTHYRIAAGYVDAEVLFVSLTLLGWQQMAQTAQRAVENHPRAARSALIAGLLCGLAYLSKGTATLLALAFGLTLLLVFGIGVLKRRFVWAYAAGFALIAAPLWIYNLRAYGNPLYNINTTHVMWLDHWDARFTFAPSELPTALTYLQTHAWPEIAARLLGGLLRAPWQWYQAAHLFWLPHVPPAWLVWTSIGAGTALLFGIVCLARQHWAQRKVKFWLGLSLCAIFYAMFAWYTPVDDSARFVLPAVPILYLALCWALQTALSRSHVERGNEKTVVWIACALFCLVYTLLKLGDLRLWRDLPAHDRAENVDSVQFIDQLIARTRPGERVVLGPTLALADWLAFDRDILAIPYVRQDWRSLSTWAVENEVKTIVLDYESWDWRRPLLAQYFGFQGGLVAAELPAGWTLAYPAQMPCNPCLFRFDGQSVIDLEPEHATAFRYGDAFQLLGFDLATAVSEQSTANIILYWQKLYEIDQDLHVFVHLVDQRGQIVGQHDSVMAGGRLPAREVMDNQIVRDVHPLPALPDGTYALHVGLYEWATWQRLVAVSEIELFSSTDYPPVGLIRVENGLIAAVQTD
ncbi:MAG: glycosyltransferase family 39 protein [Anaerolineae bacterium]|nr:glycosyltransferase family 39 protein [Anaerolineae bacterium]